MIKTASNTVRDTYLDLIYRFPLKPIRSDRQHDAATSVLQDLMGRKLNAGETDYYETLLMLITQYENQHHLIDEHMTPTQAVKALLDANGLNQKDLAQIIGSQPAASMILAGERQPSKTHIAKLCNRFKVDASLFMDIP